MIIMAYIFSGSSLLMSLLFFVREGPPPQGFRPMFAKLAASTLPAFWAIEGMAGAVMGWIYDAYWAVGMGIFGAGMMISYIRRCTREHRGFKQAFGSGWADRIPPQQTGSMLKRRWSFYVKMKTSSDSSWQRDVPFWTIPGTERQLLCDLWRPSEANASGLAFIFFHGSAWAVGHKDMLTRPFFRHLVAQGHMVMDVGYRLIPEVDIFGMVGDVKRAVAWIKADASRHGVDPEKVVLGGGSAGGHLALLAGYTPHHPEMTPEEIQDHDLTVCGVVSYYGPSDMLAEYKRYMWKKFYSKWPPVAIGTLLEPDMRWRYAGRLDILLGGHPQDVPEVYQMASPINHVHPDCPPTLLIQGEQDLLVPPDTTRMFHAKLVAAGVPAVNVIFPWTDHAFDLPLPQFSPPAQSALYDVDRFLALLTNKGGMRNE